MGRPITSQYVQRVSATKENQDKDRKRRDAILSLGFETLVEAPQELNPVQAKLNHDFTRFRLGDRGGIGCLTDDAASSKKAPNRRVHQERKGTSPT